MTREQILSIPKVRERSILKNVYLWMALGLTLTGVVAYGIASNPAMVQQLASNRLFFFAIVLGQLGLVFYISSRIMQMSAQAATLSFAAYAALNGVTMSLIFLIYTGAHISQAFFITAGTFAAMSLYGITTKRDLSSIGSYLHMALIGIIIASLVNIFLRSEMLYWLISYAGVLLFMGLTAYDTQHIKRWNDSFGPNMDEASYIKLSVLGALKLYLDFINLFMFFLRIIGGRRN